MSNYVTQGGVKIAVSSMAGPWAQISGDEAEREVTKSKPGVGEPDVLKPSPLVHADIVVTKMFNADTDVALLRRLDAGEKFAGTTVTVTYCDLDGNAIPGATRSHTDCVVKSFTAPEGDSNGTDDATLSITFSRGGAA